MSVWVAIPSVRPAEEVRRWAARWREMGYNIAVQRDPGKGITALGGDIFIRPYLGYAEAVNFLTAHILGEDPACQWCVTCGDDTFPDPIQTADTIALQCSAHFGGTFGCMQCTGDPWADGQGRIIERIAGSPWLGREWCRRANCGQGPFWPEFRHMYGDEHLQRYAQHLGVFWQRPDLTHYHAHAQRIPGGNITGNAPPAPHMTEWNSQKHWQESKAIFNRLVAGNFEECKPIT